MKQALLIFSAALLLFSMSSCTAYVDGGGYARPGYAYRNPVLHPYPRYAGPRYVYSNPNHYRGHPPGHAYGHYKNSRWNDGVGVKAKVRTPPAGLSSGTWVRF